MMVFFRTRLGKILIWQKFSSTSESNFKINGDTRGRYSTITQIKFKNTILKSGLCYYIDAYIFVRGTITITRPVTVSAARGADEGNELAIFKNCVPFTDCKSDIKNTQVDENT